MKKLFKGVALAAVAMLMVSSMAFAFDVNEHVKVAPQGKGDLMFFPFYYAANGGWQTKLTVINTSTTYSVVAKVVFRSHYYSEEVLDFLLYLTPADVWTGTLKNDGAGTYIYSEDDSALNAAGSFVTAAAPMNQKLFSPKCLAGTNSFGITDSADYGYVEIFEAWYGDLSLAYPGIQTGESRNRPVSKSFLKRVYDNWDGAANTVAANGPTHPINVNSTDHTINVLTGYLEFQNATLPGYTAGMPATVLADYDTTQKLLTTAATSLTNASTRNNIGEVEAALAKGDLAMPYSNNMSNGTFTVHMFNFPTKLSRYSTDTLTLCRYVNGVGDYWLDLTQLANPTTFASDGYRCQSYDRRYYDLKENALGTGPYSGGGSSSLWCEELNLEFTNGYDPLYTEGWTNYIPTFTAGTNRYPTDFTPAVGGTTYTYFGTPMLTSVLMFKMGGILLEDGASTDGSAFSTAKATLAAIVGGVTVGPVNAGVAAPGVTVVPWYLTAPAGTTAAWIPDYANTNEYRESGIDNY